MESRLTRKGEKTGKVHQHEKDAKANGVQSG
jgi:hypothetical protein